MTQLPVRLRRNRRSDAIRSLIQETELNAKDLIAPFFVIEGNHVIEPIISMPGVYRLSLDILLDRIKEYYAKGIRAIALFPSIEQTLRSEGGEEACNREGLIPRVIRTIKERFPSICVISDIALDPYTSHGHDGILNQKQEIANDATVEKLVQMALVHAEAGADFVAPSDMMDGRVKAIRETLDANQFEHTGILAYSAKYASALYGPYRNAIQVYLAFGDKKTYQMDPANGREALREALLDAEEGADIVMVKPALFYLDIIAKLRETINLPIAAFHVSGEYSMVMAAHNAGYLDAGKVFHEALLSIKRAGADMIFTYAIDKVLDHL